MPNAARPVNPRLASSLQTLDAMCQDLDDTVQALATAITRLTQDEVVQGLATHVGQLVSRFAEDFNVLAEEHGCNYRRERASPRSFPPSSHDEPGAMQ